MVAWEIIRMTYKVYLSGPITGLTYDNAVGWTDYAKEKLWYSNGPESTETGIVGYKPLRGKKSLSSSNPLPSIVKSSNPLTTNKAILNRDKYDVMSCDCVLANLLGAKRVSIGTVAEIAWAHFLQKNIILVMEYEGNVHEHAFVLEMATHRTDNLNEAIQIVKAILLPD
jgi:nucleoside 2-deoxyribosyltransferase